MSQRIHVAAIVVREGRVMLTREQEAGPWALPGGRLREQHADTEAAMDEVLEAIGISTPAIEEDFLETVFHRDEHGHLVYNLYAPTDWSGEPSVRPGTGLGWFAPEELAAVEMEAFVRDALLAALGLQERAADDARLLVELGRAMSEATGGPARDAGTGLRPHDAGALDQHDALNPITRSLIAVAVVAATGPEGTLRAHVDRAIAGGATRDQLAETLRMVSDLAHLNVVDDAWSSR